MRRKCSAACFPTCLTGTEGWEHYSSVFTCIENLAKTFGCAYITYANDEIFSKRIHSYVRLSRYSNTSSSDQH